ncbi:putative beta-lysine N-acetyltransferase [Methanogenium marinum]|uniref:Beta-lysine N-acetyltransferase n=1 Tax=Methanogenium marinum TaxID=348610 RepID=A0A9Q4PYD6_9EURY|nr:putative beta-lysine N-acetyltransferase [Methanogenium marinum]MDE4907722.1 putative beta-lysine N-acetyltransferase [Methanogenium marinum]
MNGLTGAMTSDTVTHLGSSVVQHGPCNDRVYLMKLGSEDTDTIIPAIEELAEQYTYSKLFAKVPASAKERFCAAGYQVEAHVPGMFGGMEDGWFLARYPEPSRADPGDAAPLTAEVLRSAKSRTEPCGNSIAASNFVIDEADRKDVDALAELYGNVFETYPFPIHDPAYLRETMDEGIRYFVARSGNRVVAASSAEVDVSGRNAEMTDFATDSAYRGMGLCPALLAAMEGRMRRSGIVTVFTIARAAFYPINITFARAGYRFGGTLVNNTNICGAFESMNVWYKSLGGKETALHQNI